MSRVIVVVVGSLVTLVALVVMLGRSTNRIGQSSVVSSGQPSLGDPLMLFCAASNRAVMEKVIEDYAAEFGRRVDVQYGPSQTLLSQIEVSLVGDLYLPADDSYLDMGREKHLIAEILPIAKMQGVVAVKKGNPKSISSFSDLLNQEIRVVQADPEAAAIGKVTRRVLDTQGLWQPLKEATTQKKTPLQTVQRVR